MATGFSVSGSVDTSHSDRGKRSYAEVTKVKPVKLEINDLHIDDQRPFIFSHINRHSVKWLVDTGAVISVMAKSLFINVMGRTIPLMERSDQIMSASGHTLKSYGTHIIQFEIGGREFSHGIVVVENLPTGAILGHDFLAKHGAHIQAKSNVVTFPDNRIPHVETLAWNKGWPVCITKSVKIPPMCVQKIKVSVKGENNEAHYAEGLLVNEDKFHIVEAICTLGNNGTTFALLFNTSHQELTIKRGSEVARFITLDKEDMIPAQQVVEELSRRVIATDISDTKRTKIEEFNNIGGPDWFRQGCKELLFKYHNCISENKFDLGRTDCMPHRIHMKTINPVHLKQFRIPWEHREVVNEFVDEMQRIGCIQVSWSPYNAPIFCVKKPHGQGLRIVQDFRAINEHSLQDKYIIREIQECIDTIGLRNSTVFTTLDLTSGFWQQLLHPSSRPYTAFTVPGRGRYEWVSMPMGLHGAPSSFARLMDHVMEGLPGILTYIDDVLAHSPDYQTHLVDLEQGL